METLSFIVFCVIFGSIFSAFSVIPACAVPARHSVLAGGASAGRSACAVTSAGRSVVKLSFSVVSAVNSFLCFPHLSG